jgi:hypothetical protein
MRSPHPLKGSYTEFFWERKKYIMEMGWQSFIYFKMIAVMPSKYITEQWITSPVNPHPLKESYTECFWERKSISWKWDRTLLFHLFWNDCSYALKVHN